MGDIAWFNADDHMHSHPKPRAAGLAAVGLWVLAGTLSTHNGTPGHVTRDEVRSLGAEAEDIQGLIDAGLWVEDGNGWAFTKDDKFWRAVERERVPIAPSLRRRIYERDGHACVTCGSRDDLTLDHIHPWSLGGKDTADNLQTMCRSCNSRKGARVS